MERDKLLNDMIVIRDIAEVDRAYPSIDLLVRVLDEAIDAIAAGTQSAETSETPAPSEGCQSGPKGIAQ